MASGLHISISAEKIASIGGLELSNSMLTSLIVSGLMILLALIIRSKLSNTNKPKGLQNVAEFVIEGLETLVHNVTNNKKKTRQFFPIIATFFLFIIFNNWFGLLPGVGTVGFLEKEEGTQYAQLLPSDTTAQVAGLSVQAADANPDEIEKAKETPHLEDDSVGYESENTESEQEAVFVPYLRAGTADINMTLALGLISITLTQFFGLWYQKLGYLSKFINFSNPIMFFVGILELISEFAKIISFAFRLFGNIFAGEVLLVVIIHLTKVVMPMPFYGLEIFVGFIQALVFAMLSVVFFNMATLSHDNH